MRHRHPPGHSTSFLFDQVQGADLSADMLARARAKIPATVPLHHADMRTLDLGRTFEAVVCLFSSIGYLQTEAELRQAIQAFAAHTAPGGVILIEPWFTPQQWHPGTIYRAAAEHHGEHIVRLAHSTTDGAHSVMTMHYLHGRHEYGVRHWTDTHRMSLMWADCCVCIGLSTLLGVVLGSLLQDLRRILGGSIRWPFTSLWPSQQPDRHTPGA